jgi:anti-anti-sigma factor
MSGAKCTLALAGDLDLASIERFHEAVKRACCDGARAIVLDLRDLRFMDSAGLHEILRLRNQVTLSVSHAPRGVSRMFEVTGVPLEQGGKAGTSEAA